MDLAGNYNSDDIVVLNNLEAVQKRPGMYIGDTDNGTGLMHMLMEVVSNSVDQYLAGKASNITVSIFENGSAEILDDGEGMPVHELQRGKSALEVIMTTLHTSATWDDHRSHTHVGALMGIGLAPINALCENVKIDSFKDGTHFQMEFNESKTEGLRVLGDTEQRGTRLSFLPSNKYLGSLEFDLDGIRARFEEISALCPGLNLYLRENLNEATHFYNPKGLTDLLAKEVDLSDAEEILHSQMILEGTKVELAFCWSKGKTFQRSFANYLCTTGGGVHADAVILGVAKAASLRSCSNIPIEKLIKDLTNNFSFIVHVNIADPLYAAPTKDRLINEEVFNAVLEVAYKMAREYFLTN